MTIPGIAASRLPRDATAPPMPARTAGLADRRAVSDPLDSRPCPPSAPRAAPATCCRPRRPTWTRLERLAADLAARYGYRRIETPLFELTDVFERGVGEVTDIVEKELFRLAPRTEEGESWALRPEPTAGIVRAYVQHGMQTWPQPVKLTETGPMFRYDRPQAGRYRQFWQFDIEAIGDPGPGHRRRDHRARRALLSRRRPRRRRGPPQLDRRRGLPAGLRRGADRVLPRPRRRRCPSSSASRLERNVLRLLDSKDPAMAALNAAAPQDHRPAVRRLRRPLRRCPRAPRRARRPRIGSSRASSAGSTTTRGPRSSSTSSGREGQQQAIGGGGRYDGLVELLGGRPTPGIGFGIGLDRLILALAETGVAAAPEPRAGRRRRRCRPGATRRRGSRSPRICERRGSRRGPSSAAASSASSSRPPPATRPTSRSSSATSWRTARSVCGTCRPGTQKLVPLADLAREIERAHGVASPRAAPDRQERRRTEMATDRWTAGTPTRRTSAAGAGPWPPTSSTGSAIAPGARWVDVGCGTGALSAAILERADPVSVVGVDPSADFVARAQAGVVDRRACAFVVGDARRLPVADGSADVVVSRARPQLHPGPRAGARAR